MTRATSQRGEGNSRHTSLVGDTLCGKNKNRYLAMFLRERVVAYTRRATAAGRPRRPRQRRFHLDAEPRCDVNFAAR
jgi:hypothetical protein